jgi:N6-L-threonylcarbamoyladenine synthase
MKILSIETSCDDTSIALIEVHETTQEVRVLSHITSSQTNLHTHYGGVFPLIAKREHAKNITPILKHVLIEAGVYTELKQIVDEQEIKEIPSIDPGMAHDLTELLSTIKKPNIDFICVTYGPGLEMALWVGINFAMALSKMWAIPLVPVNHMEGHIQSISATGEAVFKIHNFLHPYLALLISGGHTELVLAPDTHSYTIVGETKDDALGEAFDKVARMIDLPYPGGPEISRLAKIGREQGLGSWVTLPRPMINTSDMNFSFSGIKTAVLYAVREHGTLSDQEKTELAMEFENAVADVVVKKVFKAIDEYAPAELIIAGGVSANTYIKQRIQEKIITDGYQIQVHFPHLSVTGDNALMIALAGYHTIKTRPSDVLYSLNTIKAHGSLKLE